MCNPCPFTGVTYVSLDTSPSPTNITDVAGVIGAFKSLCTHEWHRMGYAGPLWQRSFYDHIVRNEDEYREISEYIDGNPVKWDKDRFYTDA